MKQRAFTLIELLAVILILGIIALIAIPTVSKIIDQSKRGAFETTANNVVSAIEDACQLQLLKGETLTTTYIFTNGVVSPSLDVKGNLPTNGTVTVNSSCDATLNVTNGKFTATKTSSVDRVTVADGSEIVNNLYANGTAVYFNPVTGAACTSAEAVSITETKTGCMKWYIINFERITDETIDMILDHNTTALLAWNSSGTNVTGPNQVLTQLKTDTAGWTGVPTRSDSYTVNNGYANYTINYSTYKAKLITANEIANITGNTTFDELTSYSPNWFFFDSNNHTQEAAAQGESSYAWLFDYTNGCIINGCNIEDLSTYGYWTSTSATSESSYAWNVSRYGYLSVYNVNSAGDRGVRPVITISKSSL